jgi:hypothetical protein
VHGCVLQACSEAGFGEFWLHTLALTIDLSSFLWHATVRVCFPVLVREKKSYNTSLHALSDPSLVYWKEVTAGPDIKRAQRFLETGA